MMPPTVPTFTAGKRVCKRSNYLLNNLMLLYVIIITISNGGPIRGTGLPYLPACISPKITAFKPSCYKLRPSYE